jgi:tetratricopeptide (TPR) repeat protein
MSTSPEFVVKQVSFPFQQSGQAPSHTSSRLNITAQNSITVNMVHHFVDQSLSYGNAAEATILEAIAHDPTCAIAHAYAAAYYLSQETAPARRQVKSHIELAQQQAVNVTQRERWYIEAIAAWAVGAIDRAIALHEAITDEYPQDLMAVQQAQYHYFYLGNSARLLQVAQKVEAANRDSDFFYGMLAFGYEQTRQLKAATAAAQRAIALNHNDPWAHHAIAHILETQQRVEEGIAWAREFSDTWNTCNSMLYTHNWWHTALFYLANDDVQSVLDLYDTHVWGGARKASPKDQVGAIALLLRLELRYGDRTLSETLQKRWHSLGNAVLERAKEHALPFQDLHFIYALDRAGYRFQADEMLDSMQAHLETLSSDLQQTWVHIALPAARGMMAHAQGDWPQAVTELKPVLSKLWVLGGSPTQRQLFKQVYRDALVKTKSNPAFRAAS